MLLFVLNSFATGTDSLNTSERFDPEKVIFTHLGDEYGWNILNAEVDAVTIPLPVIVRGHNGSWHLFSSSHLTGTNTHNGFSIAKEGSYAGKVIETLPDGSIYRPIDLSITKNVFSLIISTFIMLVFLAALARWYKRHPNKAPRGFFGAVESAIDMLYKEVIESTLGEDSRKFAPYLLTLFFFVLWVNLMGMIVVFPGGTNLTGNISITFVLALCTFIVVNLNGTRTYWKEIVSPDVPRWLKFPIPLMPVIEIFGLFTKPFALMIRLFANIMGGHIINIVLISFIFIFATYGELVMGATTVVSLTFAIFMGLIDLLICLIQAYVFMMLSTLFIALARIKH